VAANTTWTFNQSVSLVSASNDGGSAYTPTPMGASNWLGNSTTVRQITFNGSDRSIRVYGITVRSGSVGSFIRWSGVGTIYSLKSVYMWSGTGSNYAAFEFGLTGSSEIHCEDCTFRFGGTNFLSVIGDATFTRCTVASAGSAPSPFIGNGGSYGRRVNFYGCDFSHLTGTIIGNIGTGQAFYFDRCVFGSGATLYASQTTNPVGDSAEAFFSDCLVGTTRTSGYYNCLGSAVRETGIYYTGSAAGNESWKVVTTANSNWRNPFTTPWVDFYNTTTTAITPRFEILRDGSASAFDDNEVWAEFSWKNTASSPLASGLQSDSMSFVNLLAGTAGTDQANGAGTGSWTGESGTAWSGKVDSGSSITPTEAGYLCGRVVVAAPSITVYVDPVIRTA
jgi:hypothetical protein